MILYIHIILIHSFVVYFSFRMDLLSPTSAFHFPMPGAEGQSLQRHRSTSTPNVHMVSTIGPVGPIREVRALARILLIILLDSSTSGIHSSIKDVHFLLLPFAGNPKIQQHNRYVVVFVCF